MDTAIRFFTTREPKKLSSACTADARGHERGRACEGVAKKGVTQATIDESRTLQNVTASKPRASRSGRRRSREQRKGGVNLHVRGISRAILRLMVACLHRFRFATKEDSIGGTRAPIA